ncbi:hypothetical protein AALP_AA7G012500 [Arabis alpina]|uniref:DUF4283 domain-containing protein n=1 Tax=Arabis alpina TaxID=50452 RepID=A0A087GFB1_ARAAL|nr:hypothetical protein AALP_AA7G012500 [Arabis alpina]
MDSDSPGLLPPKPPPGSVLVEASGDSPAPVLIPIVSTLATVSVTTAQLGSPPAAAKVALRSGSYSSVVGSGSLRNLRKVGSPSLSVDGTPTVAAPESVLFQSQEVWKDHLLAHFHGSPPSPGKIFTDLNPIWGTHGRIAVRQYSTQNCLIYIPSEITRKWVLEVGFWQAGHCAFTVTKWSSSACLAPMKLEYAPIWVILKNVPSQLYDFEGLSVIGSGLGIPLYTEKAKLQPNRYGLAKVKIVMKLDKKFPPAVRVRDKLGNSVTVLAEYPHIPHKCQGCNEFGHLLLRCPKLIAPPSSPQLPKSLAPAKVNGVDTGLDPVVVSSDEVLSQNVVEGCIETMSSSEAQEVTSVRSKLPGEGRIEAVKRSLPPDISHESSGINRKDPPLSSGQILEEAGLVQEAQKILRERILTVPSSQFVNLSAKAKRRKRKKLRQKLLSESGECESYHSVTSTVPLVEDHQATSLTGHSHPESIHLIEA